MMTQAFVLIGLALAMPASAQTPAIPPEQAAGLVLMQCVAHATGQGAITKANASLLTANGLTYSEQPPAFLASTRSTPYGNAEYAQATSTEGQVWAVGYDRGTCLLFSLGTSVQPIEKRLDEMFAIPGSWKIEKAADADIGERKKQYGWQVRKDFKLSALVSLRDLPGDAKGMSMVTIGQTEE